MNRYFKSSAVGFEYRHRSDAKSDTGLNTRHCHDRYEIIFVTEGSGRYLIEGAEFPLKARTIAIIRPFEYHCVEVDPNTTYERYVLHFDTSSVTAEAKEILQNLGGASLGDSGTYYSSDSISQLTLSIFDRFKEAENLPEAERALYVKLVLSELVLLLSVSNKQRIVHDECELGARVTKYVNDFLDKDVSLDVISKRFFVSKYYLCRAFKKYSGVSIHSYVTNKRVMYAKQLIEAGETASGAAYKVGFGDYSAFYRAYVKVLGKPPTSK